MNRSPTPDYSERVLNLERLAALERHAGASILDVGCGNGKYVLHLRATHHVRGIDWQRFESWSEAPELFGTGDAQSLSVDSKTYDTVVSFETLEHLPEPQRALREFARVARRNVILTVPNCQLSAGMRSSGIIYNHWIDRTHVNFWSPESLAAEVSAAGLRVTHCRPINHINLGFVLMEAMGASPRVARVGAALFRRLQRRRYPMTTLLVAECDAGADGEDERATTLASP